MREDSDAGFGFHEKKEEKVGEGEFLYDYYSVYEQVKIHLTSLLVTSNQDYHQLNSLYIAINNSSQLIAEQSTEAEKKKYYSLLLYAFKHAVELNKNVGLCVTISRFFKERCPGECKEELDDIRQAALQRQSNYH